MNLSEFVKKNNIKQLTISTAIINNNHQVLDNVKLNSYLNNYDATLFFGLYNRLDYDKLNNH